MVTLLFGDYGTGKSTYILDKINADYENKIRSFLIVPEQETVIKERQIASLLPSGAQLYCEVSNLTRLSNTVFREFGGLKYNYISKSGKNLVMYRAICECRDRLTEYKIQPGHEKSCIKMFLEAIGEFKSYNVSISALEEASRLLESELLSRRINDIITVWASYEKILSERFSDPYDKLLLLAEAIKEHDYFKGTNVYFDSFYGFTNSQFDVLEAVINSAENVVFAFDCPKGATEHTIQFAKIARTANNVMSLCKRLGKEYTTACFDTDYKHKNKDLAALCKNLWDFTAEGLTSEGSITLARCSDEFEECEYVSAEICKLIRDGYKYSEIAIIARNIDTYRGILDYTLEKYEIPHFMSSSSDWLTKPLVKMIFSALSFIATNRPDDLITFAKCGYINVDQGALADLESYVTRWNIFGKKFRNDDYWSANPDGYVEKATESQAEALKRILNTRDALLDSISLLEKPFYRDATVEECCVAIYEFLNKNNILSQLEEERKSASKQDAYILSQAWQAILDALDTLYDICKNVKVDATTFSTLLHFAFIDAKVSTIPTGEDNVLIADASLVRANNIRHVFILGANEGVFPASVSEASIFSDSDKIALETVNINLSEKSDVRADDELMFFKNSIATAGEGVHICALNSSIDGSSKQPSIGFERVLALFSDLEPIDASRLDVIDKIYTPTLAKEYLTTTGAELSLAISRELDIKSHSGDFSNDSDQLNLETTKSLFGNFMSLSQTKMDSFKNCRFSFYADYYVGLSSSRKHFFSSREAGTLVHSVFEHFLGILNKERTSFEALDDKEIEKTVDRVVDDYIKIICKGAKISNRLKHLFDRLRRFLYIFVKKLVFEFKNSSFTPEYLELPFYHNREGAAEPLTFKLDNGATVTLNGFADRVDTYRHDNKTYVRVADYKIGSKSFSESDVDEGSGLQLLIYLFSLYKMKDCEFKAKLLKGTDTIVPAGFFYIPLNVGKITTKAELSGDLDTAEALERGEVERACAFNGRFLDDEEIVKAQGGSHGGLYLPEYDSKSKWRYYISLDKFEELYQKMVNSVVAIGNEMYGGNAKAEPKSIAGKDACAFCEWRPFCRRRTR